MDTEGHPGPTTVLPLQQQGGRYLRPAPPFQEE